MKGVDQLMDITEKTNKVEERVNETQGKHI